MNSQKQGRMIVFILGNGFDLAHGLKTRYTDFLATCCEEELQKNIWFNHFNKKKEEIGENWFNLEQEIYNVITNERKDATSGGIPIYPIKSRFYDFFQNNQLVPRYVKIEKELYEGSKEHSLRFFVDQFGEYLSEQLNDQYLVPKPKFQEFLKNGILFNSKFLQYFSRIRIVNFNYTNTFEKLYRDYLYREDGTLDISTYYIHGSLDKNNLVLGTQDLQDKEDPFRIFTKEYQILLYETNKDYQEFLKELKETNKKSITFHIIGHSLDEADHEILRSILCYSGSENNNGDIKIYRYEGDDPFEKQRNIEKILQYGCNKRVSSTELKKII